MTRPPRIPDLLTTANLACGVGSIILASQGQLTLACWLVFTGAAFDVLDGLAARALGGGSEFGKQLDSLADMVTFGVAPGFLIYVKSNFMLTLNGLEWDVDRSDPPFASLWNFTESWGNDVALGIYMLTVIIIAASSAWRLAHFNVDDRQNEGFRGLPTPANAIFWTSLTMVASGPYITYPPPSEYGAIIIFELIGRPWALFSLSVLLGAVMLSSIPLPSLKFKHFKWRSNEVIYLLGIIGLGLVLLYGILAVPMILLLYLLSPLWGKLFKSQLASNK